MVRKRINKKERQQKLTERLKEDPFLTDEELMQMFNVSIQTIRLDRLELGIPELRERIKSVAELTYSKVRTIGGTEIVGELVDINLGKSGISILETNENMAFKKTSLVRGHNIYAQAESLAIAVIDADVALTGVANVKYKIPVKAGEKLIAKAEVVRERGNKYFVHVFTYVGQNQVFRGKFILVSID
ncbi:fatty acid biosynthesis transcriptional regulator [Gottschalkia purinilytica]|uniref:Fatty acid biosynthesis transcriptional regulator n=1 Tax=Gottschalkia purinilytica TaxID=1503 RepID=A0A0L0WBQ1_GOTPU|nr:transcription factor FapR [Gottschalkia purinilytica]KNF08770.1 fatty acid biosynthesis transcriptional regulator [Gottschalkia purinilytica]